MTLAAIVAATPDGIIGLDGDMPWHLSSDLRRFKRLTTGHTIIMGRKTFDSIGKPLPNRQTIVLTRDATWSHQGVQVCNDQDEAVRIARQGTAFVVGGAQIYRQLLPACDRLYLTRVWSQTPGDTQIDLALGDWKCLHVERIPTGAKDSIPSEFVIFERC